MEIEYFSETRFDTDVTDLYRNLKWYGLKGYTPEEIEKANKSFYSVYAYDGYTLVGLGRIASDGLTVAVMSGICVREDYRRRGIGEEIVSRLVYYCQSGDYEMNVQLFCEDSLRNWYYKQGFVDYGVGMRKMMVYPEETCHLRKNFHEIYGIEQIINLSSDFYWDNFTSFGELKYYGIMNSRGEMVPSLYINLYSETPVKISAEFIFENVSDFSISCKGLETEIENFSISKTSDVSDERNFIVCTQNNENIYFVCENFRILNVE